MENSRRIEDVEALETDSATVRCLNAAFAADPNAMYSLICNRVPCNESLANDQFVVVDKPPIISLDCFQVGMMGVINGVLAANGLPLVATAWCEDRDAEGRQKLIGFSLWKPDGK